MFQLPPVHNREKFILFWTVSTMLGWLIVVHPGFILRNTAIFSWELIFSISIKLLALSLALGFVVGLLQYFFLHSSGIVSWKWVIVSAFSYGAGTSSAFLFLSLLLKWFYPEIFIGTGTNFFIFPLELTMMIGGGFTALLQSVFLNKHLFQSPKEILSWTLSVALSWYIGVFISTRLITIGSSILQSSVSGLIIGISTALLMNSHIIRLKHK